MPVISKFYGIIIRFLAHRTLRPQFHAFYGEHELVVGLAPLRVIQGVAPHRVCELVLEWAKCHERELLENWDRCCRAQSPMPIAPLY